MENNYVEIYGGKMYGFIYSTTNNINGKNILVKRNMMNVEIGKIILEVELF